MKKSVLKGLLLAALISNSLSVLAAPDPFASAPCLTTQNLICVQEIANQNGGQYQITNKSDQEIFMFGVTNSNAKDAYSTEFQYVLVDDTEGESFWEGVTITKDEWNNPTNDFLFGAFKAGPDYTTGDELYRHSSRALGTFESLFGTEDTAVNMYWHIQGSDQNPFTSGKLNGFFWNDSLPNSEVTVFGVNGQVLSTSVTTAVPEPETYAMFMAGLGLMGFVARRRKV